MFKTILEIYNKENDTWSRIEHGAWENERELDKHIQVLKRQCGHTCFYFKCFRNQTNIPENYKFMIHDFYERYSTVEKRNEAFNLMNKNGYNQNIG
jgi:hypothetical protein